MSERFPELVVADVAAKEQEIDDLRGVLAVLVGTGIPLLEYEDARERGRQLLVKAMTP
jgi:hypothetical protein